MLYKHTKNLEIFSYLLDFGCNPLDSDEDFSFLEIEDTSIIKKLLKYDNIMKMTMRIAYSILRNTNNMEKLELLADRGIRITKDQEEFLTKEIMILKKN